MKTLKKLKESNMKVSIGFVVVMMIIVAFVTSIVCACKEQSKLSPKEKFERDYAAVTEPMKVR